jgi:hypothetical protein
VAERKVSRHWRARFEMTFPRDPRDRFSDERTYKYSAWIGAETEEEARALLAARIAQAEIVRWELDELIDATEGEPAVIATWEGEGD